MINSFNINSLGLVIKKCNQEEEKRFGNKYIAFDERKNVNSGATPKEARDNLLSNKECVNCINCINCWTCISCEGAYGLAEEFQVKISKKNNKRQLKISKFTTQVIERCKKVNLECSRFPVYYLI